MSDKLRGGVVVVDRPQVSVEERDGVISISVAAIGAGFDTVELKDVSFPADCGKQVAEAILALLN